MNTLIDIEIFTHLRDVLHDFNCYMSGNLLLINGDCFDVLPLLPSNFIDSSVYDGPYGIGKPGKEEDNFKPRKLHRITRNRKNIDNNLQSTRSSNTHAGTYDKSQIGGYRYQQFCYRYAECTLHVLKPGAHILSCCSPQMYHRMVTGIEDAGFGIRDMIPWLFGSDFPKRHIISKAIDKIYHAERKVIRKNFNLIGRRTWSIAPHNITAPATPEAEYWDGWDTKLKPSHEPILLARKPILEKTIAHNILKWRTGGINIDACRIGDEGGTAAIVTPDKDSPCGKKAQIVKLNKGRYPSNTIISDAVALQLDDKAKFFYCPKASKSERNEGCENLKNGNTHPTPKPLALMEYLVRLITPPQGICLDIFMGSGSTGVACVKNGFGFIGIEREKEYFEIAKARIQYWQHKMQEKSA